MLDPNLTPVGSLERLKELGLDPVLYGSCSEGRKVEIVGKGKVLVNRGCAFHYECPWKNTPMPDPDRDHMRARPRMVKTRIIKPAHSGRGDVMRENYCACFQWHADMKDRDGKNGELTEVCGGEGDPVILSGSEEIIHKDGTRTFKPIGITETIPVFADPAEAAALSVDVRTAAIKKAAGDERRQRRRDARLGADGADEGPDVTPVEVDAEDVRRALESATLPGA